ncbi:FtsX-like permease family protein [Chryseolinea sp. T2]|uniref:ABC transporter permease n=1 Tax=Chryseolinea sp. T2 TaxID=3129255 RepID=UPI003076E2C1
MATSLASCILIFVFVSDELSFDNYHPDGDRTYRIYNTVTNEGVQQNLPIVPYPYASRMQESFPEIESTLRILDTYEEQLFDKDGKKSNEGQGVLSESGIFEMLSLNVVSGNRDSAVTRPGTVALSKSLAEKYFGANDPVGQSIKIDNIEREVTAVFADPPSNFHLKLRYILSLSTTNWAARFGDNFRRQQIFTYLKLKPGSDAATLESKFPAFIEKYAAPQLKELGSHYDAHLQNISDIHLHSSSFQWEIAQRGDAQSVYILIATAAIILLIAILNFVNLSTARATKRIKEVGIRKSTGALQSQLILQFLSESILVTLVGLAIAVVIAETSMPFLNAIVNKQLYIDYNFQFVSVAVLFCLTLGIAAGSYPALYLSRFRPALVLSKKRLDGSGGSMLRQSLVIVQFMLSFFLVSGSLIIIAQNKLLREKNLGFDKSHVVVIPLRSPQLTNQSTTRLRYMNHPNVVNATIGFGLPGNLVAGDGVVDPVSGKEWSTSLFCIDHYYIETMGMELVAGRNFAVEFPSDSTDAFIVNETFLKTYGLGDAESSIGRRLDWPRWDKGRNVMKRGKIIGVVKDFHFKSLREQLTPVVMQLFPYASWQMAVRIKSNDVSSTLEHLKKTYEQLDPEWTFSYEFLDERLDEMYKSEQRLGKLFLLFTYLAIGVACLGLFGLVEYTVNQRAKEISIRKVLGASVSSLLVLLTKRYAALLAFSCVVVVPVIWMAAQRWLNQFAYKINVEPAIFFKAGLLITVITAITVASLAIRAALQNPVRNLRSE